MNKNESKYYNTALLMNHALLILLDEKEYDFISVKEVCLKAGVSRSTFYLHYLSMDDLLKETIEMVNNKFLSSFDEVKDRSDLTTSVLTAYKYLKPYLSFVKDNLKIYRLIHEKENLFNINKIFNSLYNDVFSNALSNFGVQEKEKRYIFSFYCDGTLGIIKTWINGNCEDDIDFIIDLISRNTLAYEKNKK